MLEGFSLGSYLLLVDYTGRLFRKGEAMISREVSAILERIGTTADIWQARLEALRRGRLLGRFPPSAGLRLRGQSRAFERSRPIPGPARGAQPGWVPGALTLAATPQ
jgi:hypothetical protein